MKRVLILFIAGLGVALFSLAGTEQDAKIIFEQAVEKQANITFSATSISGEGVFRVEQKVIQRKNPDGTVSRRLETQGEAGGWTIHLKNDSGTYDIYPDGKKMVKINFDRADEAPDYLKYASFAMKTGQFAGHDCYIITGRIADNPTVFSAFEKAVIAGSPSPMTTPQRRQLFLRTFPATWVYYIGADDLFIYSREYYTFDGKLKGRITYTGVKFAPVIEDSVFELPSGYSTEYANNSAEFIKATHQIGTAISDKKLEAKRPHRRPSRPGFFERFSGWIDRNLSSIISASSKILFWSAMVIIIAVVVIKLKSRFMGRNESQERRK